MHSVPRTTIKLSKELRALAFAQIDELFILVETLAQFLIL